MGGLLTGMHEVGESHYRLLEAFLDRKALDGIATFAAEHGLRKHEFGDSLLILK